MKKKWMFGSLITASLLSAALVACGSGDVVEPGELDEILLENISETLTSDLVNNAIKECKENPAECDASGVESNPPAEDDTPESSSSVEPANPETPESSSSVITPVVPGVSSSSVFVPVTPSSSSSVITPPVSSSSVVITPSSSSVVITPSSSSVVIMPSSSSVVITPSSSSVVAPSSSSVTPSSSSAGIVVGDDGNITDFSPSTNASLTAGTYSIAACNGKTGSQTIQIKADFENCWDAFADVTPNYWNNLPNNCNGQASVTFPATITVPAGGTLTMTGGCW